MNILYPQRPFTWYWVSPEGNHSVRRDASRYQVIDLQLAQLARVRDQLRDAGADKAAAAVARAMKSVEGARRHAKHHGWNETPGRTR